MPWRGAIDQQAVGATIDGPVFEEPASGGPVTYATVILPASSFGDNRDLG